MVCELKEHDDAWQRYFATYAIRPYIVFYAILVEHYEETVLAIMRYLRIPMPEEVHFLPRHLQKQADAESEEWVQRYQDLKQQKGLHQTAAFAMTPFLLHFYSFPAKSTVSRLR
jgi:LPS sulfotransferase NodH